ncbi:hypothetical protein YC2023_098543 [Brassica napus]
MASSDLRRPPKRLRTPMLSEVRESTAFPRYTCSSCLRLEDHPKEAHVKLIQDEQVDVHLLQERNKRRCFTSETPLNWRQQKRDQVSNLSRLIRDAIAMKRHGEWRVSSLLSPILATRHLKPRKIDMVYVPPDKGGGRKNHVSSLSKQQWPK